MSLCRYQCLYWYIIEFNAVYTVCPGSSDPFYIVTYYIKWITPSWTHSTQRGMWTVGNPGLTSLKSIGLAKGPSTYPLYPYIACDVKEELPTIFVPSHVYARSLQKPIGFPNHDLLGFLPAVPDEIEGWPPNRE